MLVTLAAFMLVTLLPGDAVSALFAAAEGLDQNVEESLRLQFGLDRPLAVRYAQWVGRLAVGDLGRSLLSRQPVLESILARMPVTLILTAGAILLSIVIGIPLGLLAGMRPNSRADRLLSAVAALGVATPNFWLGILLVFVFAQSLGWLPSFGYRSPVEGGFWLMVQHMLLPWLTLSAARIVEVVRQVRSGTVEIMTQDFIRTARAKGLSERLVIWRHALKNVLVPVITVTGLAVGHLLSGAVVVEVIFLLPGMGTLVVEAVLLRDFPITQGVVLMGAVATIGASLIADALYGLLDPRVHYD